MSILFDSEKLRVEYFKSSLGIATTVCFVFTPSYNRSLEGNAFGGSVFNRYGADVIAFKNINDDWFQSVDFNVFEKVKIFCLLNSYQKHIGYGSSMGGFAAIAFSKILDLDEVYAFSPQLSIREDWDTRWSEFSNVINFKYVIDLESVSDRCSFFVFFDNKNPDSVHVDKLKLIVKGPNFYGIQLPFSGHPCSNYLLDISLLNQIPRYILQGDDINKMDFFSNRRESSVYYTNLSKYFKTKNKFKFSLKLINKAILISPFILSNYTEKVILLNSLFLFEESFEAVLDYFSIHFNFSIIQNNSSLLNYLNSAFLLYLIDHCNDGLLLFNFSVALEKLQHFQLAIAVINRAIHLEEFNPSYLRHKSSLCDLSGDLKGALDCMNTSINLNLNSFSNHEYYGYLLLKDGQIDNAITHLRISLSLCSDYFPAIFSLSRAFYLKADFTSALRAVELALILDPNNSVFLSHKERILLKMRNKC